MIYKKEGKKRNNMRERRIKREVIYKEGEKKREVISKKEGKKRSNKQEKRRKKIRSR